MFGKIEKGQYGYIDERKKTQAIKTLLGFVVVALIFFVGYIVCKTKNNIATVMAILCVLPTARIMVSWLMLIRYQSPSKERYNELLSQTVPDKLLSDCAMSCKDRNIYVQFAFLTDSCIYCYSEDSGFDEKYFNQHVAEFIQSCGDSVQVKLIRDYKLFYERVSALGHSEEKDKKLKRLREDFLILVH